MVSTFFYFACRFNLWNRNGFSFFIDSNTQFYDAIGQPVDMEFFENGDLVEVRGMHLNDDNYLAQEIWQRSLKQDEVSLRGTIASMQSDRLEIENTVFVLNSDTRYFLADGSETGDLGQFFPGRIVGVQAEDGQDGASGFEAEVKYVADLVVRFFETNGQSGAGGRNGLQLSPGQCVQTRVRHTPGFAG